MEENYEKMIDIRPFKAFVRLKFPKDWHLRELILAENDKIPPWEFPAYVKVWLRLLDLELRDRRTR
jgi:hypothetical protein